MPTAPHRQGIQIAFKGGATNGLMLPLVTPKNKFFDQLYIKWCNEIVNGQIAFRLS
jgi:hypothetical protein